jgi:hypothetical protein
MLHVGFGAWWCGGARARARRSSRWRWWRDSLLRWRQKGEKRRMQATTASWDSFGGSLAGRAASSSVCGRQVAGVTWCCRPPSPAEMAIRLAIGV